VSPPESGSPGWAPGQGIRQDSESEAPRITQDDDYVEPEIVRPVDLLAPQPRCTQCHTNVPKNGFTGLCRKCLGEPVPGGSEYQVRSVPRNRPDGVKNVGEFDPGPNGSKEGAVMHANRLGALSRSESLELIAKRKPEWRVAGILSTDDYGVLAGPKGVGKTFALIDLAVAVALGERWFGRFDTVRSRVLLLTSEDSRARLWRRADAVAESLGHDPADLQDWLFIHPFSFSVVTGLPTLEAELATLDPGLVLLDPVYRYMRGVKAQLFDLGPVLDPLQQTCLALGAPLVIGHHYNRQHGAQREERLSGGGILEWARLVITAEAPPRRTGDEAVTVTFEITGNSLDPMTFNVRRCVVALDDSPDPELSYSAEVIAEGTDAVRAKYITTRERVLAVLPTTSDDALTIHEIGDLVAHDDTGKGGIKHDNIRRALNRDLEGQVDRLGDRMDTRWWRVNEPA